MLNKVLLIGKVVRCSLDYLPNGTAMLKFTLRTWNGTTQFHEIVFFDEKVEVSIKYLDAFTKPNNKPYVYVEGALSYRTVELKDGSKRRYANIVARNIRILSEKPKEVEEIPSDLERLEREDLPTDPFKEKAEKKLEETIVQKSDINIKEKANDHFDFDVDVPPIDEDSLPF